MKKEKLEQIANAMSGLSYREFEEIASRIEASYHVTKKELTSEEISSVIKNIHQSYTTWRRYGLILYSLPS